MLIAVVQDENQMIVGAYVVTGSDQDAVQGLWDRHLEESAANEDGYPDAITVMEGMTEVARYTSWDF